MDATTQTLLIDLLIVPTIKKLAVERGVHGVTKENLEIFLKNPKKVMAVLKDNKGLAEKVTQDLADAVDNIASDAVDAFVAVFASFTPGGIGSNDT